MKRTNTVFASKAERKAFKIIKAGLPAGWSLYPNLPLSQIVKITKAEVSDKEWDFYLKSSVDFVLATPTDVPSLALEFDGLGGGFSAGSIYKPVGRNPDANREKKINFKLVLCRKVELPLLVISSDEMKALPGEDALRLVHGLVGQYVVHQQMQSKVRHWDKNDRGRGKKFREILWDLSVAETSLQHRYDPFRKGIEALWKEFSLLNAEWSLEPVSRPEVFEALRTRRPLESFGCRFTACGKCLRAPVVLTVWVRNFAGDALGYVLSSDFPVKWGINPLRVAENAAWYLGIKRVVGLNAESR